MESLNESSSIIILWCCICYYDGKLIRRSKIMIALIKAKSYTFKHLGQGSRQSCWHCKKQMQKPKENDPKPHDGLNLHVHRKVWPKHQGLRWKDLKKLKAFYIVQLLHHHNIPEQVHHGHGCILLPTNNCDDLTKLLQEYLFFWYPRISWNRDGLSSSSIVCLGWNQCLLLFIFILG